MVVAPRWTGLEAAALRQARRMSIRAYAAHLGLSAATVANWDRRGELARLNTETQQLLDIDLARAPDDVQQSFVHLLASHPRGVLSGGLPDGSPTVDPPEVLDWNIGVRDEPGCVSMLDVGDAAELIELSRALDQRTVGRGQLTAAELACAYLDQHYAQLGPDVVLPKVRSLLLPTIAHLRHANPLHHHRRLRILAARLAGLRAWLCFDFGEHGEAERWYDLAISAALDAEEWSLAAWLLGGRSLIPSLRHDYRQAVKHIDKAVSVLSNGADNTTRAWVYALHARGRAGLGDHDGFDESSTLALTAAERSTAHERRHGMDFVDGTLDLRYYTGTSQLLLHQPVPAGRMLSASLDSLPTEHTKARAVLTLNLAEAAVQTGQIDEAITLTSNALTSAISQPILPIIHQARRIRTALGTQHAAATIELDDNLHQFATALTHRRAIGS